MPGPFELAERRAKGAEIAAVAEAGYAQLGVTEPGLVADALEAIVDPAVRGALATKAGRPAPSEETWAEVVATFRRRALVAAGDPFASHLQVVR